MEVNRYTVDIDNRTMGSREIPSARPQLEPIQEERVDRPVCIDGYDTSADRNGWKLERNVW